MATPTTAPVPPPRSPSRLAPAGVNWLGLAILLAGLFLAFHASFTLDHGHDVNAYHDYAVGFWKHLGHPQLPVEYPPLSVIPFGLTLLSDPTSYETAFAAGMATLAALGYLAVNRLGTSSAALAYAVYLVAGAGITTLFRFDIIPALAALLAVLAAERRWFTSAYALVGLGAMLKLFPLALVPVIAIAHWRHRGGGGRRAVLVGTGSCLVVVALSFGAAILIDPEHALGALTYQIQRPIEVEAVPASVMWIASQVGLPIRSVFTFHSVNLLSPIDGPVVGIMAAAGLLGSLWTYWRQLQGNLSTRSAALGVILIVLSTSKVFSAQYLIWAIPLVAIVSGLDFRWLMVCILTTLSYPIIFMYTQSTPLLATVTVRNAIVVYLTCLLLLPRPAGPRGDS